MSSPKSGYYRLRATDTGFQLSWVGNSMSVNLDDEGSHGPLAELYSAVERVFHEGKKVADRQQQDVAHMSDIVAGINEPRRSQA